MIFGREPVVITTLIGALLNAGIGFGLHITDAQKALLMLLVAAIMAAWARSSVTPNAKIVNNTVVGALLAGLCLLGGTRSAWAAPPTLSLDRFSAGPRAFAQVYDFDSHAPREFGFVAGAAASYNLTSRWDANASAERKFNAGATVPPHWRYSAGVDVRLPQSNDRQQWFLAVERAWYKYPDSPATSGSWVARLQWAWGAQNAASRDYAFAVARGRYDVDRGVRDYGAGIQPQLIGGH